MQEKVLFRSLFAQYSDIYSGDLSHAVSIESFLVSDTIFVKFRGPTLCFSV